MLDLIRSALEIARNHVEHNATATGLYRFGDLSVNVRVAATQKAADLLRMVEHQRIASSMPDAAEINVIEGWHAGLEKLLPPSEHREKRLVETTADYYYYWTPERGGNLTTLDRRARRALLWYPAAGEIASWEFSRPFLAAIHAFLLPTSWTPVHAAAVAKNGDAILIAGRGGVGKTTTALVCAEAGWDYLSDDFVLVGRTPWRAAGMYRSARMREDMFVRLPRSMAAVTNISTDDGELRAEVDVGAVGRIGSNDAEIRAIVLPQRAGAEQSALTPIRRSQVLSALAGPTLIVLAGGHAEIFGKLAELVNQIPCYGFEPGPRLADIPGTLAPLLRKR